MIRKKSRLILDSFSETELGSRPTLNQVFGGKIGDAIKKAGKKEGEKTGKDALEEAQEIKVRGDIERIEGNAKEDGKFSANEQTKVDAIDKDVEALGGLKKQDLGTLKKIKEAFKLMDDKEDLFEVKDNKYINKDAKKVDDLINELNTKADKANKEREAPADTSKSK